MRIYIDTIDSELSEQGSAIGYRVTFQSALTRGTALLAATPTVRPSLRGTEIFVEVEAQAFQAIGVLSGEEVHEHCLIALPQEGHFQAVGEVVSARLMEADDVVMVGVRVADALFHWTPEEEDKNALAPGNWVRFTVVGLFLWDMNL